MNDIYILLAIIGIFILYVMCGGSIYYPTSYRAFIPKALDSEYKEYAKFPKKALFILALYRNIYKIIILCKKKDLKARCSY